MRKSLLLLTFMAWSGLLSYAQTRPVKGKVLDEKGNPVAAAYIMIKGTSIGTTTDVDGSFELSVPDESNVLVVEALGYGVKEINAGDGDNQLSIQVSPQATSLDETVVIGYMTVRKKDLTGSVSKVKAEDLKDIPNMTIEKALQGRAAGVQVVQNSGTPGSGIDMRIRGTTSINGNTQPLYVVDGVIVTTGATSALDLGGQDNNALAQINPDDIESYEVLKDAATTAMYGSRAANGVVLITTKKGKYNQEGFSTINFNTSYGTQSAWKKLKTLNNQQYYDLLGDEVRNLVGDQTLTNEEAIIDMLGWEMNPGTHTNYLDYIFRNARTQDHNLSISGGTGKTNYYASLGYSQNEGILRSTQFDRYSTRLNVETQATNYLKIGANLGYTNSVDIRTKNDNNIYGYLLPSLMLAPDQPLYNADSTYFVNSLGWENPAALANSYYNRMKTNRFIGNGFADLKILPYLNFRTSLGTDVLDSREQEYDPVTTMAGSGNNGIGVAAFTNITRWINENYLTFNKNWNSSALTLVAGASFEQSKASSITAQSSNFISPEIFNLTTASKPLTASSTSSTQALQSFYFNGNFSYEGRYIASVSVRADGSSRFPGDNKFATFPGVALAWRISEENFFQNAKNVVSDLKLRAGYGVTGNLPNALFGYQQLYSAINFADNIGVIPTQLENNDLKWETTEQINAAIDASFLKNRIALTAEYFTRNTKNLILAAPYASQTGWSSRLENIGEMSNKGWEFTINSQNLTGDFRWSTSLNLTAMKNTVNKLYGGQDLLFGFSGSTIIREGESIGSFYGFQVEKIFQTQNEIDELNSKSPTGNFQNAGTAPGDFKYVDVNKDGRITDADRVLLGNALPKLFGGFGNNFSYKGLELDIFCQFSVGNKVFNANRQYVNAMSSVFNQTDEVLDRWTPENTNTNVPRAILNDPNSNDRNSDYFVEDGSYFRIKNVSLAYNFNTSTWGDVYKVVKGLRLYVSSNNLFTFTKYKGFDPEVNTFSGSSAVLGTDFGTYPQARSLVIGANFTF